MCVDGRCQSDNDSSSKDVSAESIGRKSVEATIILDRPIAKVSKERILRNSFLFVY